MRNSGRKATKTGARYRRSNILGYRIPICNIHEADDSSRMCPLFEMRRPFLCRVHEQIYASVIARKAEWNMEAKLARRRSSTMATIPVCEAPQKIRRNLLLMERAVQELLASGLAHELRARSGQRRAPGGEWKIPPGYRVMERIGRIDPPEVRERLLTLYGSMPSKPSASTRF